LTSPTLSPCPRATRCGAVGLLSLTPHIAGASPAGHRAANQLAADQLGRWLRGEPLENIVVSAG
jgi:phosphoglycerate dehydrogenase-like enzyme